MNEEQLNEILRKGGYSDTALKEISPDVKQMMVDIVEGRVQPTEAQLKPMIEMLDVADKPGWTWPWQKEHYESLPGWAANALKAWGIAGTTALATVLSGGNPLVGLAAAGVATGGAVSPTGGGETPLPEWAGMPVQGYAPETGEDYASTVVGQMTLDEVMNELQMQGIPYTDIAGKSEAELKQMLANTYAEALAPAEAGAYPDWATDLSKVPTEPLSEGYHWAQGALDITGTPGWVPQYDPLWQTRAPEAATPWGQQGLTQPAWSAAPQNWWEVAEYERAMQPSERMGLGVLPEPVGRFTPGLEARQPLYGETGAMQPPAGGWQVQTPTMAEYRGMTEDELRQMQSWMGAGQTQRGWQDWLKDIYKLAPPKARQGLTYR